MSLEQKNITQFVKKSQPTLRTWIRIKTYRLHTDKAVYRNSFAVYTQANKHNFVVNLPGLRHF